MNARIRKTARLLKPAGGADEIREYEGKFNFE
jgi:hypothetical protein